MVVPVLFFVFALATATPQQCNSTLYCIGTMFDTIQLLGIFSDSKTYVDMPTTKPPAEIIEAFNALPTPHTKEQVEEFLDTYFLPAGANVLPYKPADWQPQPPFLSGIALAELRTFGLAVHTTWLKLTKHFNSTPFCTGCTSSAVNIPFPFVVPGGRFREFYYWDTYFVIQGLITSNMATTAEDMIRNFLYLIETYGYVPNGGRIYYASRSQPPLLTQMIDDYLAWKQQQKTNESSANSENSEIDPLLSEAVPFLDTEYEFWQTYRSVSLPSKSRPGATVTLNQYNSFSSLPRPESYKEDYVLAQKLPATQRPLLFRNLISTAETGWDFSSRWMKDPKIGLLSLQTTEVVEADLNAILYKNELTLARFHRILGNQAKSNFYLQAAKNRAEAIGDYLWNPASLLWHDYDLVSHTQRHLSTFYPSNLMPMFMGIPHPNLSGLFSRYHQYLFGYPSGIPASTLHDTENQWDWPNVWAPYGFWLARFLEEDAGKHVEALQVAQHWIDTTLCGWNRTGYLFEKYDAVELGESGGGGEYVPQEGFGWTNGVALAFLEKYGKELKVRVDCPHSG